MESDDEQLFHNQERVADLLSRQIRRDAALPRVRDVPTTVSYHFELQKQQYNFVKKWLAFYNRGSGG